MLQHKAKKQRVSWNTDGIADGKTSMDIVLEWLTAEGNYNRWRDGDKNSGDTKTALATKINNIMIANGISNRKPKDIVTKISTIESDYRAARDWQENTGQGIDSEVTIEEELKKRCPCFFLVDAVMRDRPSVTPLATSDSTGQPDESSEDEKIDGKRKPQSIGNTPDKKRSLAQSKLDDWADLNRRAYELKEAEIAQKQQDVLLDRRLNEDRLAIEIKGEERLAEESKWNVRLLEIRAREAEWGLQIKKEQAEIANRIKIIETRKRLLEEGWSEADIEYACPLMQSTL
ncbi:hypothetical protein AC1031_014460 [Aphanomyces cochlioides]|nr:hypothetical protein AC1031_014460 [Aphanomyces cochlioides]